MARLKNSITPTTEPPTTIGNASAACSPSATATSARGKLSSSATSAIHVAWLLAHTRPGNPTPRAKVVERVMASNAANDDESACHDAIDRSRVPLRSVCHRAPCSQPRVVQIASRICVVARASGPGAASTRTVASSAAERGPHAPGSRPSYGAVMVNTDQLSKWQQAKGKRKGLAAAGATRDGDAAGAVHLG